MDLWYIAVFALGALLYSALLPARWRGWALLGASIVAVYRLQPPSPVRYVDFILPTVTLLLCLFVWWLARAPQQKATRADGITLAVIAALVVGLSLTRYLIPELRPTASRAPDTLVIVVALGALAAVGALLWRLLRGWRSLLTAGIGLIGLLFVVLKTEALATILSAALRDFAGQDPTRANAADLTWLGFSYVAFRLIHTLRERQMSKLPTLGLRDYMTYVIFFPALTAGPIDRAERFVKDMGTLAETRLFAAPRLVEGGGRIAVGLLKKFVLADSLALFALNTANAEQAVSAPALWLLLYAYALRLFFDFSGYSDIAIGIGLWLGVRLPENFDRPYLKSNLAAFWQSWHITLSSWLRFYVFSPLSRALLMRKVPAAAAVFAAQMLTMALIGLWHGVSWGFVVWGLWHGAGLFAHKLWSDRTRKAYLRLGQYPRLKTVWTLTGSALTFHYVVLGWVWFALPDITQGARVFGRLFGLP